MLEDDPLALDRETMRQLGYRTVDLLVERLNDPTTPLLRRATPTQMEERLHEPPAAGPEPFEQLLARLERDVLPFMSWTAHPGFFAFVPSAGTWPGALGDFMASALNVYAGSWMESAGPSRLELEVLGWFADWVGFPETTAGSLTTGGSAANMTALACAREALAGPMDDRLVVYVSDQAHSSLARGARILGFRPDQVRVLPVDGAFRLDPRRVGAAIDADVRAGRTPLLLAASGGATNTGAVDPLAELAALCRERGVWFHVDAAYGGFSVLTERGRATLAGIELADSLTLDPHKWLYQPFECGCLLVREGAALRRAFQITPDYLRDAEVHDEGEVNFSDLGLQLTRNTRALKVWLSLRAFGLDAFRGAIDRSLDLAELARRRLEESDVLEPMAPSSLGVVCFRRRWDDTDDEQELERRNAQLVSALEESGIALASSTRLHGRYAIRLCILNHTSGPEHVEAALDFLERAHVETGPVAAAGYDRHRDITHTFVAAVEPDGTVLGALPLFERLSGAETEHALALASPRDAVVGETVVAQWDVSRDFFVLVSGTVEVRIDGERVRELGPGDFFGELAALDWGAGFGYPRLATVVATSPVRLLVYPDGALNRLVAELPSVGAAIRAAVTERLGE